MHINSMGRGLMGADSGASARKSRSQRAAGIGAQFGTHLSRNGLSMLIEDHSPDPTSHVAVA